MTHFPIVRILATTAASWLLLGAANAQGPAGRNRAEVEGISNFRAVAELS